MLDVLWRIMATRDLETAEHAVRVQRLCVAVGHEIGLDNIMWESDFPHSTSTFPESRQFVDRCLKGVPDAERKQLCYGNAMRTYSLS